MQKIKKILIVKEKQINFKFLVTRLTESVIEHLSVEAEHCLTLQGIYSILPPSISPAYAERTMKRLVCFELFHG